MGNGRRERIFLKRRLIVTLFITICLLKVTTVQSCEEGDIKQVIDKVGQRIILWTSCNEPADSDQFIWSLLPENYVLVNYDNGHHESQDQETPRCISELKRRIHLDSNSGSLTIEDVGINDTHLYYGQVHKKGRPSSHLKFNVTILGPVSTPHIKPIPSSVDDSCQSLTVECSVENGRDVTLSWYRGEERLNQTSSPDLSTNLSLLLEIKDQDGDYNYSCKVENPVDEMVSQLHIDETCLRNRVPHPAIPWVIGVVCLCLCLCLAYFLTIPKWNIGEPEVNNQDGTQRTILNWVCWKVQGSAGRSGKEKVHQPEHPASEMALLKVVVGGEKQTGEPIQPPADAE